MWPFAKSFSPKQVLHVVAALPSLNLQTFFASGVEVAVSRDASAPHCHVAKPWQTLLVLFPGPVTRHHPDEDAIPPQTPA